MYCGKHERNRRVMAENNADYVGKHENLVNSIAEIFTELCSALDITAEFITEITAPARKLAEKVTARVRKTLAKRIPMPEIGIRWKYAGFWDAKVYDIPIVYDGKGYVFLHAGIV